MKEQVLVIDKEAMECLKGLPGLSTNTKDREIFVQDVLTTAQFIDRDIAEESPELKQVIPYTIIKCDGKILVYKRTSKGGEERLHEKYSIGIGGHINPIDSVADGNIISTVWRAASREIDEELSFSEELNIEDIGVGIVGLLYDPSDSVGEVHFGYVLSVNLKDVNKLPVPADASTSELAWMTVEEAKKLENLENWSKIILEKMGH